MHKYCLYMYVQKVFDRDQIENVELIVTCSTLTDHVFEIVMFDLISMFNYNFCFVYTGHYDKCIAQLISKTKDMSAVAGSIFSHLAVQNKNLLVTMLIVRPHSVSDSLFILQE